MSGIKGRSGRKKYTQEVAQRLVIEKALNIVERNLHKKGDIRVALPIVLKYMGNKVVGDASQPLFIQVASELQDRYKLEAKQEPILKSTGEGTEVLNKTIEGHIIDTTTSIANTISNTNESIENKDFETTPTPPLETNGEKVNIPLEILPQNETKELANISNNNDETNTSTIGDNEGQQPIQSD